MQGLGKAQRKKIKKEMSKTFRNMLQSGVVLYMEDHVCKPNEISNLMYESGGYMADYIIDESGRLCEVHFDKVTQAP